MRLTILALLIILTAGKYTDCINNRQGNYIESIRPDGLYIDFYYGLMLRLSWAKLNMLDKQIEGLNGKLKTRWEVLSYTYDHKWVVSPYLIECEYTSGKLIFYGEFEDEYRNKLFEVEEGK